MGYDIKLECLFCKYTTNRKYNLDRHEINKHSKEIMLKIKTHQTTQNVKNVNVSEKNVNVSEKNVNVLEKNVNLSEKNVNFYKLMCKKCNKIYKVKKSLIEHEKKCKGIDELTCSRCMKSFTSRQAKSNHCKRNTCKARSILHARIPNQQNINTQQNAKIINNININNTNINNTNIENQQNNIIINNYGNERIDYITNKEMVRILLSGNNTLPLYVENKHFNNIFPENNNIKYTNECKCLLKDDDIWKEKDLNILSNELIKDNSKILLLYCDNNKIDLENKIKNEEHIKHVKDKLIILYNKTDNDKYNNILTRIKELIKTNS